MKKIQVSKWTYELVKETINNRFDNDFEDNCIEEIQALQADLDRFEVKEGV